MEGIFYYHEPTFILSAFDIASQEVSVVMTTHPPLDDGPCLWKLWPNYLIECDGDLFLVYFC